MQRRYKKHRKLQNLDAGNSASSALGTWTTTGCRRTRGASASLKKPHWVAQQTIREVTLQLKASKIWKKNANEQVLPQSKIHSDKKQLLHGVHSKDFFKLLIISPMINGDRCWQTGNNCISLYQWIQISYYNVCLSRKEWFSKFIELNLSVSKGDKIRYCADVLLFFYSYSLFKIFNFLKN